MKWIKYINLQTYRAEVFRFTGYTLCTPFCIYALGGILNPEPILIQLLHCWNLHLAICLVMAWFGLKSIYKGATIMTELNNEEAK